MNNKKQSIVRVVNRIEYELETIKEEGFIHPTCWHALDRIKQIRIVCQKILDGDELACVDGFGKENAESAKYFDQLKW